MSIGVIASVVVGMFIYNNIGIFEGIADILCIILILLGIVGLVIWGIISFFMWWDDNISPHINKLGIGNKVRIWTDKKMEKYHQSRK